MLIERYNEVKEHVKEACERVGRDPREVTVIAVSKTKPLDKYANISWPVRWHLIGHLQTNKIKYIVDKVALIHSVDSVKLAQAIDKEAVKHNVKEVPILIQVNFAHEDTKFGLDPKDVEDVIKEISKLEYVKIKGLMQIAPFVDDPEDNRKYFRAMKQLSVDIKNKNFDNVDMSILSIGERNYNI